MAENKIGQIIGTSLERIKDIIDVNTIIGDPINTPNGTVIIPVSKVSIGLASGGLDYLGKNSLPEKDKALSNFGGGGGTGVTVAPIGFLVIPPEGEVRLLNIAAPADNAPGDVVGSVASLIEKSPDILTRLKKVFAKEKSESTADSANTASE